MRRFKFTPLGLVVLAAMYAPKVAHAASGGGGGMPWDNGLNTIKQDITGPTAFVIALIALAVCGITYSMMQEIGPFMRGFLIAIMVASALAGITNLAAALGIAGALIA